MQWPREKGRTENTMSKRKRKDLYFQFFLFLLAIAFSVLPFSLGHCIFSSSFFSWPLHFQSFLFLLAIVFSVLPFSLTEELKIQWPREKGRTENSMAKRKRKG
jgi:magnesium-transporting ATPase (P-type)